MTAQDLSPAEAAIVARFDAAPTPPEVLREQVARLLFCEFVNGDGSHWTHPGDWAQEQRDECYRVADAALAVFRDQQDPAVQRVLELTAPNGVPLHDSKRIKVGEIRAAIGGAR